RHSERSEESACRQRFFASLRMTGSGTERCQNLPVQGPQGSPSGSYKPHPLLKLYAIFSVLILLFLLFPITQHAYADGGAPNLAYVAGTAKGISVIDISQQKVITTFSLNGDPHMVYLSLDGRFLYIAQPTLGRVTLLATKTGQTVCTANVPGQPTLLAFDAGLN